MTQAELDFLIRVPRLLVDIVKEMEKTNELLAKLVEKENTQMSQ